MSSSINGIDLIECSICLAPITDHKSQKKLNCSHLFHHACIDPWLKIKDTCPNCRRLVDIKLMPEVKSPSIEFPQHNPLFLAFLDELSDIIPEEDPRAELIRERVDRLRQERPIAPENRLQSFRASFHNSRLVHLVRRVKRRTSRLFTCGG